MKWKINMASNFTSRVSLHELWININENHVNYLCEDKSSIKFKYRDILLNYIKEFINIVSHKKKFRFTKTAEILRRSVQKINDFNALKASSAWLALSTYANNLFSQPWRKEYYEIKLYSGFYKHQIENNLSGAEAMLELMGYRREGYKMILDSPVNLDLLSRASLDALIAMCECQVLFSIYREVAKHIPSFTWNDILHFREVYTGSTEEAINTILSPRPYQSEYCNDCLYSYSHYASNCCRKCHESALRMQPAFMPINGFRNYCANNVSYSLSSLPNPHCSNGHCGHVPTAKLIDIDDSFEFSCPANRKVNSARWSMNDHHSKYRDNYLSTDSSFDEENVRKRENSLGSRKITDGLNSRKSWEYVYKELENKDKLKEKECLRSAKNSIKSNARSSLVSEALNNLKLSPESESSNYFTEDVVDNYKQTITNKGNFKTVKDKCSSIEINSKKIKSVYGDHSKTASNTFCRSEYEENSKNFKSCNLDKSTWECLKCTYHNDISLDVCEMCSKSRNIGNEIPLISGGKHCQTCTLVNKKEATTCEACDSNLQDSPTYV